MNFAAPGAAALAAVGLLVVAQYFLKIRRPPLTVPSTFLWRRVVADTRANTPWQRLRAEPLLLLQLAAIALLVCALMRPFVLRAGSVNADVVIILDTSVNSQYVDHGRSVIDLERQRANGIVGDLPKGRSVSVIQLDGHPRVLLAGSIDPGAIAATIAGLRPDYQRPDTQAAMALARGLVSSASGSRTTLMLLRSAVTVPPAPGAVTGLQDVPFGDASSANLGISSLAATLQPDGSVSVVVRIVNTGTTRRETDIDISADGKLQTVVHVTVRGMSSVIEQAPFIGHPRIVEAHITAADALAADNFAWATLASANRRILLVSPGNYFLSTALGLAADTAVITTTNSAYSASAAASTDAAIFDGATPPSLPGVNLLLVDPPLSTLGVRVGATRTVGPLAVNDDPAGLLRYIAPSDIHVRVAHTLSVPLWAHVALRDGNGPLMLEGDEPTGSGAGTRRVAILAFSLNDSDLPLGLNFPVLMSNVLNWLAPPAGVDRSSLRPGEFVRVTVPAGSTSATITTPDGRHVAISGPGNEVVGQVLFSDTDLPGAYTVRVSTGSNTHTSLFAVNTGVVPANSAGNESSPASGVTRTGPGHGEVPLDLTSGVAVLIVAVLAAEWFVAMRMR